MDEGELNTLRDLFANVEDGSTVSGSIFFGMKNLATGEEIEAIELDVEIRKLVEKEEAFNAIIVCPEISPVYDEAEKALEGLFCADDSHENAEQIHLTYQSTDYYSEGFITSAILGYLGLDDSYTLNFRSFDGENPGKFYARIEKQTGHVWDISREYAFVPSWDPFSSDIIALTGSHVTDHVHDYTAAVTAPTCTEGGYTTYTCACGDSYVDDYTDALGHNFGEWTVTTAPTCTEAGEETRYCSRCDAFETRTVSALGHSYTGVVTAPTCTERGYTTYTCSRCGDSYVSDYVAALGHTAGQTVIENEVTPTCTVGHYWEEVVYCTVCGEEISREAKSTEALGHDWDEGVVTTPPTETAEGVRTYTCRRCGSTYEEIIPALDHKPGDVTGDGIVNTKDLLRLMKYLSGENVTVSEGALDVDGNGVVNPKDLVRLLKYLSGEDVEIF
jgi:hypothetical protein